MFVTKDHTIHAKCEGMVKFTKELVKGKRFTFVHVIPALDINRTVKYPKSFVYHPEQFPDLEEFNPEPANWSVPEQIVQQNKKKSFDKIKFEYRKLFKESKEYNPQDYLSTSKYSLF